MRLTLYKALCGEAPRFTERKDHRMSKYSDLMKKVFDSQRVGKGVDKEPESPKNFIGFFKYFKRHFNDIFKVNILLVIGSFPVFFALYAMTGNLNNISTAPTSPIFAQLHGAMLHGTQLSPVTMAMFGVHGIQGELSVMTTATAVMFSLTGLLIFTLGPVTTGATYLLRNLIKGEPLFFWQDFKYSVKRNLKQGLLLGIIDSLIIVLLAYNITLSYFNLGTYVTNFVFYANIALIFLFLLMRPYLYLMLVTFDLSIFKLFKNALIFAIIGAKRNIPAFVGAALVIAVNWFLLGVFAPLGVCMPLFITLGAVWYIFIYAAFPKIKEIMIDPYYDDDGNVKKSAGESAEA